MNNLKNYELLKDSISELIKLEKKIVRNTQKEFEMTLQNTTQKRRDNMRNNINYDCMYRDKLKHEVHCRSVEAGLAMLEPDRYTTKEYRPDSWHKYPVTFRKPTIQIK